MAVASPHRSHISWAQGWRWANGLLQPLSRLPPEICCMFLWLWLNGIDLNCCFLGRLSLGCQKSLWCMEPYEWDFSTLWVYNAIWSFPFTKTLCQTFPTWWPGMDANAGKSGMQQITHYATCAHQGRLHMHLHSAACQEIKHRRYLKVEFPISQLPPTTAKRHA